VRIEVPNGVRCAPTGGVWKGLCPFHHPRKFVGNFMMVSKGYDVTSLPWSLHSRRLIQE